MQIPDSVWFVVGGAALVFIAVLVRLFNRSRRINLTQANSPDEKPEWMRSMPPKETIAATQAKGKGIALFGRDEGEQLAAPFAEQIEDILRAELAQNPALASLDVDFGTAEDGGLVIWLDGTAYAAIDQLPDERLRAAIRRATQKWQKGQ